MNCKGISLVELLVAMAILGVILGILNVFFVSNQDLSRQQITGADINLMLKQSTLRLNEVLSQASYIYPAGQMLTRGSENLTTGVSTIAALVPEDTTYCPKDTDTIREYCGYIYTVAPRANYASYLGQSGGTTNSVLVEHKTDSVINWIIGTIPTKNWSTFASTSGVVVDSIDSSVTSLGAGANMILADISKRAADDKTVLTFSYADVITSQLGNPSAANALIQSVNYTIGISYTYKGEAISSNRSGRTLAKAVPRSGLPIISN